MVRQLTANHLSPSSNLGTAYTILTLKKYVLTLVYFGASYSFLTDFKGCHTGPFFYVHNKKIHFSYALCVLFLYPTAGQKLFMA